MKKLDYGSGRKPKEGFLSSDYTGLPIYDYMIQDYKVLDTEDEEFDVVHVRNVVHHIPERDLHKFFHEFYRLIPVGGALIVSEPAEEYYTQNKILDLIWYRFLVKNWDMYIPQGYVDYRKYLKGFEEVSCEREVKNDIRIFKKVGY